MGVWGDDWMGLRFWMETRFFLALWSDPLPSKLVTDWRLRRWQQSLHVWKKYLYCCRYFLDEFISACIQSIRGGISMCHGVKKIYIAYFETWICNICMYGCVWEWVCVYLEWAGGWMSATRAAFFKWTLHFSCWALSLIPNPNNQNRLPWPIHVYLSMYMIRAFAPL